MVIAWHDIRVLCKVSDTTENPMSKFTLNKCSKNEVCISWVGTLWKILTSPVTVASRCFQNAFKLVVRSFNERELTIGEQVSRRDSLRSPSWFCLLPFSRCLADQLICRSNEDHEQIKSCAANLLEHRCAVSLHARSNPICTPVEMYSGAGWTAQGFHKIALNPLLSYAQSKCPSSHRTRGA